jgi:uncharacterized protein YycO
MALFQKPIALDPGVGGLSIGISALAPADIIVSTSGAAVSGGIRVVTGSVVSHASLYAGGELVIEAIKPAVTKRTLAESLHDAELAVAYRSPHMKGSIAASIVNFAMKQVGSPYSALRASASADPLLCRLGGSTQTAFFCSQLVIEAYRQGGLSLTTTPPQCVTPDDIVQIAIQGLVYVGHLKGNASWFPVLSP